MSEKHLSSGDLYFEVILNSGKSINVLDVKDGMDVNLISRINWVEVITIDGCEAKICTSEIAAVIERYYEK